MPEPHTSELPKPKSWDEFEDIVWNLYTRLWNDPHAQRNGRSGQSQHGVDTYGQPQGRNGQFVGIQCKRYNDGILTQTVIEQEITKAEHFQPALAEFIIATTESRDAPLQEAIRLINATRIPTNKFLVRLVFWEDLCNDLTNPTNYDLLKHFYPSWFLVFGQAASASPNVGQLPPDSESLPESSHIWHVPYERNWVFTGRTAVLEHLHNQFNASGRERPGQPQAISALPGMGKTSIALEYAYRYRSEYQVVLWVGADTSERLAAEFEALAVVLDLPEKKEKEQQLVVAAVKHWLENNAGWLLILDNVEDLEMIGKFLPLQGQGHILLTTPAGATGTVAQRTVLDQMTPEEGAWFLLRRAKLLAADAVISDASGTQDAQAKTISETLGGLPLALDQAGAYIEETNCGLDSYLALYQTHRAKLLKRRGRLPVGHPESVSVTFALAFEKVRQVDKYAVEMLRLCAFLHSEAIPEELFTEGGSALPLSLKYVAADPLRWNQALEVLHRYSLVTRQPAVRLLSLHRLVQAVLKDQLRPTDQRRRAEQVVVLVNRAFPEPEVANWEQCQRMLPQALSCADLIDQHHLITEEAGDLLNSMGYYLLARSAYIQAARPLQTALAIREELLGPNHLQVAQSLTNLGVLSQNQGHYATALQLFERALAIHIQQLGEEHPDTALSLHYLGDLSRIQGQYGEAQSLLQRALTIREQKLGPHHPHVAQSLNALALLHQTQGRYNEAQSLVERALAIQQEVQGPHHPDVGISQSNLASIYVAQGLHEQALSIFQQALDTLKQSLGPDHLVVARILNNLVHLYYQQGQYQQAIPFIQQALAMWEQELGPHHPYVASGLSNLASLYQELGQLDKAEALFKLALTIRKQAFGENHPTVAATLNNLGSLYQEWKSYEQAESYYEEARTIYEQRYGPAHPEVMTTLNNIASLYYSQKRFEEALPLFEQVLQIREQTLEPDHIDTATSLNNLASVYQARGQDEDALPLLERAQAILERRLEPNRPYLAKTLNNLASIYRAQGQQDRASQLYQRALAILKQVQPEHPDTALCMEHYAALLCEMGEEEQAHELEVSAQAIYTKASGSR